MTTAFDCLFLALWVLLVQPLNRCSVGAAGEADRTRSHTSAASLESEGKEILLLDYESCIPLHVELPMALGRKAKITAMRDIFADSELVYGCTDCPVWTMGSTRSEVLGRKNDTFKFRIDTLVSDAYIRHYQLDSLLVFLEGKHVIIECDRTGETEKTVSRMQTILNVLPLHRRPAHVWVEDFTESMLKEAVHITNELLDSDKQSVDLTSIKLDVSINNEYRQTIQSFATRQTLCGNGFCSDVREDDTEDRQTLDDAIKVAPSCATGLSVEDRFVLDKVQVAKESSVTPNETRSKLLCMTYTISNNHNAIRDIVNTWGKRCDGYLAFSNQSDADLSILEIVPDVEGWKEDYYDMWRKVQKIWVTIADSVIDDYDYFLLGGDDMYVVVENLRHLLDSSAIRNYSENGQKAVYLGRRLHANKYMGFHSGGSGYVLNQRAVQVFRMAYQMNRPECLFGIKASMEDLLVGNCLRQIGGIDPLDPVADRAELAKYADQNDFCNDSESQSCNPKAHKNSSHNVFDADMLEAIRYPDLHDEDIFHPHTPHNMYMPTDVDMEWYRNMADHYEGGLACCSRHSISFQEIKPPRYNMTCMHSYLYPTTK
jgi:glycoprotein-N-acetylgalactosamine 3-beta-galactosyltransferase